MGLMMAFAGSFEKLFLDLESLGFFTYILPFLLIFALVYGILSNIKIFKENKGVVAIIAIVIGLLALWQGIAVQFFAEIFPRLGIALSILITAVILIGIFVPLGGENEWGWGNGIFLGIGALAFLVTIIRSTEVYSWYTGGWFEQNLSLFIVGLIIVAAIVAVIVSQKSSS